MTAVRKTVSLHPQTVQKVAKNAVATYPAKKKPGKRKRPSNSRVKHTVWHDGVDPLIVAWVRENKIHWRRIEVVNATTIIVHHPRH